MQEPARHLSFSVSMILIATLVALLCLSCGGSKGLSSPQIYGDRNRDSAPQTESTTTPITEDPPVEEAVATKAVDTGNGSKASNVKATATQSTTADSLELHRPSPGREHHNKVAKKNSNLHRGDSNYHIQIDGVDSAAAVDDEIWRYFDLAEEYHAMGVIANREASWEEAQYYFEKCLKILANLDVETDSLLTPEATKYNSLLDDLVADYRVALRSLGQLAEETGTSVLLERFGELENKLGHDTLVVFNQETSPITYDLPVVMNDRVKSSIIYFQTVAKENFTRYLQRSKKYEPLFRRVLSEYGLPLDLIYLSLVESGYNPNAYSWARAMGLWQFISSTGRSYGLMRNWWIDERKDPVKSTYSAARFLKDLYTEFGNWELAMAAYNGGPGRVRKTIKKQKTIDFWKLRLRRQTMDYIPLIYAAAIIAKDPERYGFNNIEFEPEVVWDQVEISRCLELKTVAKELGCSLKELKQLNPELLRNYTPPNTKKYMLKIPPGTKHEFLAAYDGMPSPKETSWVKHRIKRGETVSTIAARYGVSQYAIFEANNLRRTSRIFAGRTLIVPVPLDREYNQSSGSKRNYTAEGSIYNVRSGDTMWDIARAFGTSVNALRRINYIERGSRIYVGQKLRIPSDATRLKSKSKPPLRYASKPNNPNPDRSNKATGTTSGSAKKYTVKAGDTLWDIARLFGTTTSKIRNLNGLGRSSRIYPGQKLTVQTDGTTDYVIHKIKRGDTLSRIAQKYRTTVSRILATNALLDPDEIRVGDNLKIYLR